LSKFNDFLIIQYFQTFENISIIKLSLIQGKLAQNKSNESTRESWRWTLWSTSIDYRRLTNCWQWQ